VRGVNAYHAVAATMSTATTVMTYVDTRREGLAGSFVVVAELRFGSAAMAPFLWDLSTGPGRWQAAALDSHAAQVR
jgi:hypothetical protein